jgi:ADP-heptose:LPS heptosyltransferase
LLDRPALRLVSLQKGAAAAQAAEAPFAGRILTDDIAAARDFADTAALVQRLDLVISVDTAVAHLAGALGVPVWVLSRFDGCWRWLLDRDDSPWYPTARLFRQPALGDWAPTLRAVTEAARELAPPP